MPTSPASLPPRTSEAARAAGDVIEVLEVIWERGRDTASTQVSGSQLRVLYALERREGINLRTLGEMLRAAPPSVSRLCDRLQSLGFVERSASPASRRELELRLSALGKSYLRELREKRERELTEALDAMPGARRAALLQGLRGLGRLLRDPGGGR
ncbi:MarR family winged helix-turn-helix transcriptional regulator [Streptomyces sp. NPDC003023]|uniref:MarR family winged helix-turn-helix transcriptional regulator n=1 Tax=Streptomyces sp. NPDC003023 TaxID=3364675 RepID=UPI0036ABF6D9